MNLTMFRGVRFNRSFRRQRFDHATGKIEPIDIVQLSADETTRYQALTTDQERKAFEQELAPKFAHQLLRRALGTTDNPSQ